MDLVGHCALLRHKPHFPKQMLKFSCNLQCDKVYRGGMNIIKVTALRSVDEQMKMCLIGI